LPRAAPATNAPHQLLHEHDAHDRAATHACQRDERLDERRHLASQSDHPGQCLVQPAHHQCDGRSDQQDRNPERKRRHRGFGEAAGDAGE
jgi:hypothetical protein